MRIITLLFIISICIYISIYILGIEEGKREALREVYKIYKQQIWNEHTEEMRGHTYRGSR